MLHSDMRLGRREPFLVDQELDRLGDRQLHRPVEIHIDAHDDVVGGVFGTGTR